MKKFYEVPEIEATVIADVITDMVPGGSQDSSDEF